MKRSLWSGFAIILVFALSFQPAAARLPAAPQGGELVAHPILGNLQVRQAIAHCTNKAALVAAAYPDMEPGDQAALLMDSFFPIDHWAYTAPTAKYPYNPAAGQSLLDDAGWVEVPGRPFRTKGGAELVLSLISSGSEMRRAYQLVFQDQMADCGIRVILSDNFSDIFNHRNFEMGAYTWLNDATDVEDMYGLYGCSSVPSALNGWVGLNHSGWCNAAADAALLLGDDVTRTQAQRIADYAIVQNEFAADLPVLPLFERPDVADGFYGWEHIDFNLNALFTYANPRSHPVLGETAVRQAIGHCVDKEALLAAGFPELDHTQRLELLTDTFFPTGHWAYTAPAVSYNYNPEAAALLLDSAGWTLPPTGSPYRTRSGVELRLTVTTTNAAFRLAYIPVLQSQLQACGIHLVVDQQSPSIAFAKIAERNIELAAFAWIYGDDAVQTAYELFSCDSIPLPVNDWEGLNVGGWCNRAASQALLAATDTSLPQADRKTLLAEAQDHFAADMPALPLFQRPDSTDVINMEYLYFNLDTFSQVISVPEDTDSEFILSGYDILGLLQIKAGAVLAPVDLKFTPLEAVPPVESSKSLVSGFSLVALENGLPLDDFTFALPVRLKTFYNTSALPGYLDRSTLGIYYWDGNAWADAYLSCPEGHRFFENDPNAGYVAVNLCHLSEFALTGNNQFKLYLPLTTR